MWFTFFLHYSIKTEIAFKIACQNNKYIIYINSTTLYLFFCGIQWYFDHRLYLFFNQNIIDLFFFNLHFLHTCCSFARCVKLAEICIKYKMLAHAYIYFAQLGVQSDSEHGKPLRKLILVPTFREAANRLALDTHHHIFAILFYFSPYFTTI